MLDTFDSKLGQSVYMTELYDYLELNKEKYSRFIKHDIFENPYFEKDKDYLPTMASNSNLSKRGQFRQEIILHIDCAKKICMVSKSSKGNEIRNELVKLTKQVETGVYLTGKDFMDLVRMIKIFAVYENRQKALTKNSDNFITNTLLVKPYLKDHNNLLYSKFHEWRNNILQTGKEVLEKRVKEYCLLEHRRLPAKFTQDEALAMMGNYEQIKNAVWDLLSSQNRSKEFIDNMCSLTQDLSKELQPFLQRLNESNLFFEKIDMKEMKAIGLS